LSSSYDVKRKRLYDSLAACASDSDFWNLVAEVFSFQCEYNPLLKEFVFRTSYSNQNKFRFLPISFFKSHSVKTGEWIEDKVFTSSGTTGLATSSHFVRQEERYLQNTQTIFENAYGALEDYCFLCLLPSYLERDGSSLVSMCDYFISKSNDERSAFYLYDHETLFQTLTELKKECKPTILIGVSYALLDFAEKYEVDSWDQLIVMKTGGMKGRRAEMNMSELDKVLMRSFQVPSIQGEYGMTECLSQLYSKGENIYQENHRMKIILTDLSDPFQSVEIGKTGRVNIIDLANIDSCSFIATDDIGVKSGDGEISILGRIDHSDLRGCNLLL